jgi:hypothetical protein
LRFPGTFRTHAVVTATEQLYVRMSMFWLMKCTEPSTMAKLTPLE